ncbi:MAG: DoxX family protein, partial [Akkermansiaceae bacterium]|nr:DoxX family protein [Akkermansiaceae bacterium]
FFPLNWMSVHVSLGATIAAELCCAALIILGLGTRLAAFVLGFTMVVAAFVVKADKSFFISPPVYDAKEPALLYLAAMIVLIIIGAGRFSLDAIIGKDRRSKLKIAI